jgi:SAM-dependent methyltransferase
MIYTGAGDFIKQGEEWKNFFIENGLKSNHTFLDIGSGIGRIALGLKHYLKGEYHGFEAIKTGVDWCQKNISSKYPNFNFKWVPLHNDLYNSGGIDASKYEFEYDVNTFDFIVSISVFTHMIDTELENYLIQSNRVLKNEGVMIATFFITDNGLNGANEHLSKNFNFRFEYDNYFLMDKNVKSANVCYKKDYLISIINNSGFDIIGATKGYWSGSPKIRYLGFQDILVLKKKKMQKS